MKAKTKFTKLWSLLLALVMLVGMLPMSAHAWDTVIECEYCGSICGDDYICDGGDHCSETSGRDCYEAHHCISCGACLSDATRCPMCLETCSECGDWCDTCEVCLECALEYNTHCPDCYDCVFDVPHCLMCYRCFGCGGECSEACDDCCLDCHRSEGAACENCDTCYVYDDDVYCPTCKLCYECTGGYCLSCGQCGNDVVLCGGCGEYCSECVNMCPECESVCSECYDYLCPSCNTCYFCGDLCAECFNCAECFDLCSSCGLCEECTDLCESCHEYCNQCALMCVDCGLCEFCASTMCENCGEYCAYCATLCNGCLYCEHCADICQECLEGCSNCVVMCETCGMCLYCCKDGIVIDSIDVTITEPVAGFLGDKNVVENSGRFSYRDVTWQHNGADMAKGERFVAGETYTAKIFLSKQPNDTFADDVKVTINGSIPGTNIVTENFYDYIYFYAEFVAVNPTIIGSVDVTVIKPVAGERPQIGISNTANVSVTGTSFHDTKDNIWLTLETSYTFEVGKTYEMYVILAADYGYEFSEDTTVTINGSNIGEIISNDTTEIIYEAYVTATAEPTEYAITVTDGTATPATAAEGTTVTLTANAAPSGKVFDKWVVEIGSITLADASSASTTFKMPAGAVRVKATYKAASHTHKLTLVSANPATSTTPGNKAYYTCDGCDKWFEDASGSVEITDKTSVIIPPTGSTPTECDGGESCPSGKFTDIKAKAWYHLYVDYAVTNGLFGGTSAKTFEPETAMTRAMLVTVLWRYEGKPMGYQNTFEDVNEKNGSWYIDAVAWAASNGIVNGTGNNRFDPNGKITREQMAAILFRYAQKKGIDTSKRGDLSNFPDANKISSYAKEAVCWAVGEGLIKGSDGKILPQGKATRAQVATILMRYIENIVKK